MFEGLVVTFVSWHLGFLIWKWVHTMAVQAVTGGCIWKCPEYMFSVGRCCKQYCTQAGQKLGPQGGGKTLPFFILKPSTCAAPERVCLCYCDFSMRVPGRKELRKIAEWQRSPPEAGGCWSGPRPQKPAVSCMLSSVSGCLQAPRGYHLG